MKIAQRSSNGESVILVFHMCLLLFSYTFATTFTFNLLARSDLQGENLYHLASGLAHLSLFSKALRQNLTYRMWAVCSSTQGFSSSVDIQPSLTLDHHLVILSIRFFPFSKWRRWTSCFLRIFPISQLAYYTHRWGVSCVAFVLPSSLLQGWEWCAWWAGCGAWFPSGVDYKRMIYFLCPPHKLGRAFILP